MLGSVNNAELLGSGAAAQPVAATLNSGHTYVGTAENFPADVAMSGDCTLSNTGAILCPTIYSMDNGSNFVQVVKATTYYSWKNATMSNTTSQSSTPEFAKAACTIQNVEYWWEGNNTLDTANSGDTIAFQILKDCGLGTSTCTALTTTASSSVVYYNTWGGHTWVKSGITDSLTADESFVCSAVVSSSGSITTNNKMSIGCRVTCR